MVRFPALASTSEFPVGGLIILLAHGNHVPNCDSRSTTHRSRSWLVSPFGISSMWQLAPELFFLVFHMLLIHPHEASMPSQNNKKSLHFPSIDQYIQLALNTIGLYYGQHPFQFSTGKATVNFLGLPVLWHAFYTSSGWRLGVNNDWMCWNYSRALTMMWIRHRFPIPSTHQFGRNLNMVVVFMILHHQLLSVSWILCIIVGSTCQSEHSIPVPLWAPMLILGCPYSMCDWSICRLGCCLVPPQILINICNGVAHWPGGEWSQSACYAAFPCWLYLIGGASCQ